VFVLWVLCGVVCFCLLGFCGCVLLGEDLCFGSI